MEVPICRYQIGPKCLGILDCGQRERGVTAATSGVIDCRSHISVPEAQMPAGREYLAEWVSVKQAVG